MSERKLHFETLQLHVGQEQADPVTDSRAVPIYQTTSYVFRNSQHAADRFGLADAGNIYGRLTNSTQDVFEKRIAALEGGVAALATASGAAAITYTIEALAQAGDHIVAQKTIYGGSYNLLEHTLTQFGVTTTFVDAHDLEEVENAIQPNTKAVYLETLGNPNSDIPDIDAIAAIAHKHGLPLVIDNTFGTPYLIRPIEHGADIVVHSATKFIGGHGTTLGGIIVDSGNFDWKASGRYPNIAAKAIERAEKEKNISIAHYDLRFLKPLDEEMLHEIGRSFSRIITIEDGIRKGGMGTAILEFMSDNEYTPHVHRIGVPDKFVEHGTIQELYHLCGMDEEGILEAININCHDKERSNKDI